MDTRIGSLCVVLAVGLGGLSLQAADVAAPPTKGKVLLLENERTLEGDIERVDDRYRVRRTVGETWVSAERVLCLAQSHQELYAYLRARANLHDPDERLRLARWCYLYELREPALAEVTAAAALRPEHVPTQRLLASLQRSVVPMNRSAPAPESAEPPPPAPPVDVTQQALSHFVTRVQPILLNACANCHASERGGSFKLIRPHDTELIGSRTLQSNLTATLAQINLDQPQASPLLTKALSVHGGLKSPPLHGRQAAAFRTLEEWVKVATASQPRVASAPRAVGVPVMPARPESSEEKKPDAAPAGPPDPYDPSAFNRQAHPEKK